MKYEGQLEGMSVRDTTQYLCSLGNRRFAFVWERYRLFKELASFRVDRTLEEYKAAAPPGQSSSVHIIEAIVNAEKWYRGHSFDSKPWVDSGKFRRLEWDNYIAMIRYQRTETIAVIAEKELKETLKSLNMLWDDDCLESFRERIKKDQEETFTYHLISLSR